MLTEKEIYERVKALAATHGVWWYEGQWPRFDPTRGHAANNAADLVHEVAHWLVAHPSRRRKQHFGLGTPDFTYPVFPQGHVALSEGSCQQEEGRASLLGIGMLFDCGGNWKSMLAEHTWDESWMTRTDVKTFQRRVRLFCKRGWISSSAQDALLRAIAEVSRKLRA